ncbi:hypothetical protein GO755_30475 [Spirosoma sp. HMF4905]|uniref:Uncharacterized protein n=1 Tax=Spirosoma arboris TaxID=2682092 RepID=A0A7K1SKR2_9BACT|nr:hypothetical protein [Spirosoma arboris]MVM34397.1 hypothetical protein [Spirosoma arboris]
MIPRDRIQIVRSVRASDNAGGSTKSGETELLNGLAEVKELKSPSRPDLIQQKLSLVIQAKFWKRAGLVLLAGDTLIWNNRRFTLQGPDVAEDFKNVVRVVTAIQQ